MSLLHSLLCAAQMTSRAITIRIKDDTPMEIHIHQLLSTSCFSFTEKKEYISVKQEYHLIIIDVRLHILYAK